MVESFARYFGAVDDQPMITLHHIPSSFAAAVASEPEPAAGVPTTAPAAPYVSDQSEARWYGNSLWEFLIPSAATNGTLSVLQATMPEGFSPPRHIHTREDEVF